MKDIAKLQWKIIGLILKKTPEACRKFYSNQKLIAGLPPKVVTPKKVKINATIGAKLKKKLKNNPKRSYRKLARWLKEEEGVDISYRTIQRFFSKNEWISIPIPYKIPLRPMNRQKRLNFAKLYVDDVDFTNRILWSDETSVTAYPTQKKILIKVHSSSKESEIPFIPKVQQGGFSIMFWGCFSRYAKGPLRVVEGKIDSEKYLELVQETVMPELATSEHNLVFMQDNVLARPK